MQCANLVLENGAEDEHVLFALIPLGYDKAEALDDVGGLACLDVVDVRLLVLVSKEEGFSKHKRQPRMLVASKVNDSLQEQKPSFVKAVSKHLQDEIYRLHLGDEESTVKEIIHIIRGTHILNEVVLSESKSKIILALINEIIDTLVD